MTLKSSLERAAVETIYNGDAGGDVARAVQNPDSFHLVQNTRSIVGNATVLPDLAWQEFDRIVLEEKRDRLVAANDLIDRGLVKRTRGLGATVLKWQDASDMGPAEASMDAVSRGQRDRQTFSTNFLPLTIFFKDVSFSKRDIEASKDPVFGIPLDTSALQEATKLVFELIETVTFTGLSGYAAGGGSIRGYEDFSFRNTGSLTANWDSSAANGTTIRNDVANMIQAKTDAKFHGMDSVLYIPSAYQKVLGEDYKANSDKTIKTRLLELDGLSDIKVADKMTANNVILSQMTADNMRMVIGLDIQTIHWSTDGMTENFKVMAIVVPNPRATQGGRSGIVHYT